MAVTNNYQYNLPPDGNESWGPSIRSFITDVDLKLFQLFTATGSIPTTAALDLRYAALNHSQSQDSIVGLTQRLLAMESGIATNTTRNDRQDTGLDNLTSLLLTKSNVGHRHEIDDINGLRDLLNGFSSRLGSIETRLIAIEKRLDANNVTAPTTSVGTLTGDFGITYLSNRIVNYLATVNSSSGSLISYAWDFGDGVVGSGQSVSHIYSQAGQYAVKLTATGADGSTFTTSHTARVNPIQSAAASSTQSSFSSLRSGPAVMDGSANTDFVTNTAKLNWSGLSFGSVTPKQATLTFAITCDISGVTVPVKINGADGGTRSTKANDLVTYSYTFTYTGGDVSVVVGGIDGFSTGNGGSYNGSASGAQLTFTY